METLAIAGLGQVVALTIPPPAAALTDGIRSAWSRCLSDDPATTSVEVTAPASGPFGVETAMQHLTQMVTRALLSEAAGKLLLLHASALCHPETGRSVVCVARGGTGKTTFAREFGQKYGYLSDETAGFTADGRLFPFPKPLSVRTEHGHKLEVSPDDLALQPAHPAPTVAAIWLLDRRSGPATVTDLDLFDALVQIAPQSSSLSKFPSPLRTLGSLVEAVGPARFVSYDEASSLADHLAEAIGAVP